MNLAILLMQAAGGSGGGNPLVTFILPFVLVIGVFYFLIMRPQKKRENERQEMIDAIAKGDKIVTVGGVHGTVRRVEDESILTEVDSNVKLRFDKNAVANVENKDGG